MATNNTVGYIALPSGLTFDSTHKYSAASNILTTSLVPLAIDSTKFPSDIAARYDRGTLRVKELWFKSNVVVTISQNHAGTQGLITFAADTWWSLPFEGCLDNTFEMKGANATNTTEYFLVLA